MRDLFSPAERERIRQTALAQQIAEQATKRIAA